MDFESPDVEKDFPGLYASESTRKNQLRDSDYSDDEKTSKKDLLGKRREKKESKKDKGYVAFEGESSEDELDETRSPGKTKKNRSAFKFPGKDKKEKLGKQKDIKDKREEEKDAKSCKKEKDAKDCKKEKEKECKEIKKGKPKDKDKKKKDSKLLRIKSSDKKKKTLETDVAEDRPIFGVPLQEAVERNRSHDGIGLPVVVRECIDYIEEHGLACEGIYRISGVKSKVRHLKSQYNRGEKVYLYEHEPHIVASLLKQFLRDLPEPILTNELMSKFEEAAAMKNEQKKVETLARLIESLPSCNRLLLSWIFVHMLHVVNLEKRNKMNLQNVSIVLSPTMQISHRVLHALFAHSKELFKGVEIKKYIPPIEPDSSRLSLELPDSPTAIEDELCKQENLLNVIHEELNTGLRDKEKEEQLWEVQRVVTQLKRKLRFLRQVQDASKPIVEDSQTAKNETCHVNSPKLEPVHLQVTELNMQNCSNQLDVNDSETVTDHCVTSETDNQMLKSDKVSPTELNKSEDLPTNTDEIQSPSEVSENPSVQKTTMQTDVTNIENLREENLREDNDDEVKLAYPVIEETFPKGASENIDTSEITKAESKSPDVSSQEELLSLYRKEMMLRIQQEELLLLSDELRRKVNSEKLEVERLRQEILEYQQLYKYKQYSFDSTENSSSDSEDSSGSDAEESEDLANILQELINENAILEKKKLELSREIQKEREKCVNIKVQMKMLQKEAQCVQV